MLKKGALLLFVSIVYLVSSAQMKEKDLQKLWTIDNILGFTNEFNGVDEYNVFPIPKERGINYGNLLEFNGDNTFHSHYIAPCGNDVFPETFGTYQIVDENHIHLQLDSATLFNTYSTDKNFNEKIQVDLGVFIMDKTLNGFRLIRSDKDEKDDRRRLYSTVVDSVLKNTDKYSSLIWDGKLKPSDRNDNYKKVFEIGLKKSNLYDFNESKLVYTTEQGLDSISYLFQYKDELYLVIYRSGPLQYLIFKVNSDLVHN